MLWLIPFSLLLFVLGLAWVAARCRQWFFALVASFLLGGLLVFALLLMYGRGDEVLTPLRGGPFVAWCVGTTLLLGCAVVAMVLGAIARAVARARQQRLSAQAPATGECPVPREGTDGPAMGRR